MIYFGGVGVSGFALGVLERSNPLPAGRYWVDVFEQDLANWQNWLARNSQNVKTEVTQHFESDPVRDFFIFRVSSPVAWEGPGFPTIADPAVTSSADTGQRPPPEKDPLDKIPDLANSIGNFFSSPPVKVVGTGIAVIVGGAFLLYVIHHATEQPRHA